MIQNSRTGRGSAENSLNIIAGHQVSRNQWPDGESEGTRVVWPQEERTGKAGESNLQNTAAKKRE